MMASRSSSRGISTTTAAERLFALPQIQSALTQLPRISSAVQRIYLAPVPWAGGTSKACPLWCNAGPSLTLCKENAGIERFERRNHRQRETLHPRMPTKKLPPPHHLALRLGGSVRDRLPLSETPIGT